MYYGRILALKSRNQVQLFTKSKKKKAQKIFASTMKAILDKLFGIPFSYLQRVLRIHGPTSMLIC